MAPFQQQKARARVERVTDAEARIGYGMMAPRPPATCGNRLPLP